MNLRSFECAVATVTEADTVMSAAALLRDRGVGSVVVVRGRRPVAILTDRDLSVRVIAEGRDPRTALVRDVATYGPFTIDAGSDLETAATTMQRHGVRRLPMVDEAGDLVGIVCADDLVMTYGRGLAALGEGIAAAADACD